MRLFGFILGFLFILGLVRVTPPTNRDIPPWLTGWWRKAAATLRRPAAENADSADASAKEPPTAYPPPDDLAKEAAPAGAPQQPVAPQPFNPPLILEPRQPPSPVPPESGSEPQTQQVATEKRPEDKKWQPFWQPFSTPGSAHGFARSIADRTGLEVKVVRVRVGRYQVAFAYRNGADRIAHTRMIERKLGLKIELPDEGP